MPSSSSSVNMEISSTGTTAEITFVAFIWWCRIDESYDGDNDDDNNDDTYAHDNGDYDSHVDDNNDSDKLLPVVIISLSSTIDQTGR